MPKIEVASKNYVNNEISKINSFGEANGNIINIDNSVNASLINLKMYGKSTQGYASHGSEPLGKNLIDPMKLVKNGLDPYTGGEIINVARARTDFIKAVYTDNHTHIIPDGFTLMSVYNYDSNKNFLGFDYYEEGCYLRFLYKRNDGLEITEDDLETLRKSLLFSTETDIAYETYYSNPNPDCPVPIESIGDSGSLTVTTCGKNIFPWNDYNEAPFIQHHSSIVRTGSEITISTVEGNTSTARGIYISSKWVNDFLKPFSGCKITLSAEMMTDTPGLLYTMGLDNRSKSVYLTNSWEKYSVTTDFDATVTSNHMHFYVRNASESHTFKVRNIQIVLGSTATSYDPYKSTTTEITTSLPLRGIPVDSNGNYTDNNGQQWICDELIVNADGTGKIIKYIDSIVFDGSSDESWTLSSSAARIMSNVIKNVAKPNPSAVGQSRNIMPCLCNQLTAISPYNSINGQEGVTIDYETILALSFADLVGNSSLTVWTDRLATNPITLIYQLATPVETELTSDEVQSLLKLQTYDGVTNIFNTDNANMDVKYWRNSNIPKLLETRVSDYEFNIHTSNKSNPHNVTKDQVGLGDVENKSSETIRSELTKKNITDALGYTPPESDTTYSSAGSSLGLVKSGGDVTISNGEISVNDNSHKHTVSNISDFPKSMPASDVSSWAKESTKPTYTATEVGADPSGSANTALNSAKSYTDTKISNLINSAPTTLDTLGEIATAMKENENVVSALDSAIGTKANNSDLTSHTSNKSNPHGVTKAQIGLDNVENKSSATIRGELTKSNITDALGYTPPTTDTKYTHPNSGATAGTYRSVTVNAQGHVTAGSNPTITIAQGGTGATTAKAAEYNILKDIPESTAALTDNAIFILKKTTPDSTNGVFVWKYATLIWDYIKSKISSVLGLTPTQYNGNSATATKASCISTVEGTDDTYRNILFNHSSDITRVCYDTDFQYNPATNTAKIGSVMIGNNITLSYDESTESLSFTFK